MHKAHTIAVASNIIDIAKENPDVDGQRQELNNGQEADKQENGNSTRRS